jgi:hypothetical protein
MDPPGLVELLAYACNGDTLAVVRSAACRKAQRVELSLVQHTLAPERFQLAWGIFLHLSHLQNSGAQTPEFLMEGAPSAENGVI